MCAYKPNGCEIIYNDQKKELNLAQLDLTTLPDKIIESYGKSAVHLDLSNNRIKNLHWIYAFDNLKYLILDCNRLTESHFQTLTLPLEQVKLLMLNKNELTDLDTTIAHLSRLFPQLEYLSLHGNPICPDDLELKPFCHYVDYNYDFYKTQLLKSFKHLKFLDHSAIDGLAMCGVTPEHKLRILKFSPKMLWSKFIGTITEVQYTPLCTTTRSGCHFTSIRKVKKKLYDGKNSEGNRYICNNDL